MKDFHRKLPTPMAVLRNERPIWKLDAAEDVLWNNVCGNCDRKVLRNEKEHCFCMIGLDWIANESNETILFNFW